MKLIVAPNENMITYAYIKLQLCLLDSAGHLWSGRATARLRSRACLTKASTA